MPRSLQNARMRITSPVRAGRPASRESRTAGSRPEALGLLRTVIRLSGPGPPVNP
jgi:hypothetical protein